MNDSLFFQDRSLDPSNLYGRSASSLCDAPGALAARSGFQPYRPDPSAQQQQQPQQQGPQASSASHSAAAAHAAAAHAAAAAAAQQPPPSAYQLDTPYAAAAAAAAYHQSLYPPHLRHPYRYFFFSTYFL